jgi:hypothetical protein
MGALQRRVNKMGEWYAQEARHFRASGNHWLEDDMPEIHERRGRYALVSSYHPDEMFRNEHGRMVAKPKGKRRKRIAVIKQKFAPRPIREICVRGNTTAILWHQEKVAPDDLPVAIAEGKLVLFREFMKEP